MLFAYIKLDAEELLQRDPAGFCIQELSLVLDGLWSRFRDRSGHAFAVEPKQYALPMAPEPISHDGGYGWDYRGNSLSGLFLWPTALRAGCRNGNNDLRTVPCRLQSCDFYSVRPLG